MIIVFLILYVLLSLGVGSIGSRRKIGFTSSFIFAIIFSPIIGWLITLAYPPTENSKDPAYNDYLHYAMKAYHKGDMEGAYKRLNSAILRAPKEPEAYLRLGALYAKDGKVAMAIKNVARAKSLGVKSLDLVTKEPFDKIRQSPEWVSFVQNDFELVSTAKVTQISKSDELMKFAELFEKGLLTKEEFEEQKKKILG